MLPGDRVAALRLDKNPREHFFLLHQMYGARGNTVLLDARGCLLWARHRPPTGLLAVPPPPATWTEGAADTAPSGGREVSRLAFRHLISRLTVAHQQNYRSSLDRVRRSNERLVGNLQQDHENAEKSEHYRRQAETLAAHLHEVRQGQDRLEVPDLRDGEPRDIALDPAQSPAANLDAWFRKARKAEKGREIIRERLDEARREAEKLDRAADRLEDITRSHDGEDEELLDGLADLLDWHDQHADLLPTRGGQATPTGRHGPDQPARPFRRYLIDDTFEVWVGRNNKENDELTHRASHSRDLWLHAQGVSGSHVILRTAGKPEAVPRSVLAKAAALAALNSKARHSSLVPVIYTERRYVRKPRKSPPGLATCLRDQSLFVEPGIHPGVRSI